MTTNVQFEHRISFTVDKNLHENQCLSHTRTVYGALTLLKVNTFKLSKI